MSVEKGLTLLIECLKLSKSLLLYWLLLHLDQSLFYAMQGSANFPYTEFLVFNCYVIVLILIRLVLRWNSEGNIVSQDVFVFGELVCFLTCETSLKHLPCCVAIQ